MGCTSSAQNTLSPNAHKADKSIQFEEETDEKASSIEVDAADIEDENRTNETKVLPPCDTFEETVQLVRNNKSTASLVSEIEAPTNVHVTESVTAPLPPENDQNDENKIPKLELLMDKVFEINHHLSESNHKEIESEEVPANSNKEALVEKTETSAEEKTTDITPETSDKPKTEDKNTDEKEEESEEASPSQSQSSRATRWEALADIAAELPPSLAVDPLTGQIYALTK